MLNNGVTIEETFMGELVQKQLLSNEVNQHITVMGVGAFGEQAIDYLSDHKVKNACLYKVNQNQEKSSTSISECIKNLRFNANKNIACTSKLEQGINTLLNEECSRVLIVDSEKMSDLQLALQVIKEHQSPVILVILQNTKTAQTNSIKYDLSMLMEEAHSSLFIPLSSIESELYEFHLISSLIELILFDYPGNVDAAIDAADVLTILAGNGNIDNETLNSINTCYVHATEQHSIYSAFSHAVTRLDMPPEVNSNVIAQVELNLKKYSFEDFEQALEQIRKQYKGDCYLAPKHNEARVETEIAVTLFMTQEKYEASKGKDIPQFLKMS